MKLSDFDLSYLTSIKFRLLGKRYLLKDKNDSTRYDRRITKVIALDNAAAYAIRLGFFKSYYIIIGYKEAEDLVV